MTTGSNTANETMNRTDLSHKMIPFDIQRRKTVSAEAKFMSVISRLV